MYAIIVYDISTERVTKVCHFLRQHLNWIQNSVFEGEITESQLEKIKHRLKELTEVDCDSVIIYTTPSKDRIQKQHIGIIKNDPTTIL